MSTPRGFEPVLATNTSRRPSLLKSPTAAPSGLGPTGTEGPRVTPPEPGVHPTLMALSLHDGVEHRPPAHSRLWQSLLALHGRPGAQPGQVPPQSTSLSVPFFTASVHVGAWQKFILQIWLAQSLFTLHRRRSLHGGQ